MKARFSILLGIVLFSAAGCKPKEASTTSAAPTSPSKAAISLFDGKSLTGWTNEKGEKPTGDAWTIGDGILHLKGKGGNLISEKEFSSFELEWEWKISEGGNSGLKYWVNAIEGQQLGIEYQMLDDNKHPDAKKRGNHTTASFYDILAVSSDKPLKPVGEWNHSKVVALNGKLEHWLNGKLVGTADTQSEDWKKGLAESKFAKYPTFAPGKGRILLQDHNDEVWFRNIRIKEL